LKTRGRKHSPGERNLLRQVKSEFTKLKDRFGAREAARQLRVSLPSFYNYAAGKDLPRVEVLRDVQERWGVEWEYLDPSEILFARRFKSAEQLLLPYIQSVEEEDVEIVEVGAGRDSCLHVKLRIKFPSST
jgi:hypothetical protein